MDLYKRVCDGDSDGAADIYCPWGVCCQEFDSYLTHFDENDEGHDGLPSEDILIRLQQLLDDNLIRLDWLNNGYNELWIVAYPLTAREIAKCRML